MRKWPTLAAMLLASCIPAAEHRPPPPAGIGQSEPQATKICLVRLSREGIRFRTLPDRRLENGCSMVGTVELLDIGTPVTNLGAMTCPLAYAFGRWVREGVQPAARASLGSRVVKIESFGTYACRPVNGQEGARLSEHGRANAVDIGAFALADGRRITVAEGWSGADGSVRRFLRAVHDDGCRRFRVGLGPDANAYHRDHLHFDLGPGPYCR